jgi:DnaJ domain
MSDEPHRVLGVAAHATADEVRRAYRRLARRYHPDRNPDPDAAARFGEIKAAHDALLARLAHGTTAAPRAADPSPGSAPVEPFDPLDWEDLRDLRAEDLWRPALYLVAAVVWLSALCGFATFVQRWSELPTARPAPAEQRP